jgi:hypothetical protein
MQKHNSQTGSAHIAAIVVLVIALVGALGYIFWNNFLNKEETAVSKTENTSAAKQVCADGENETAEKGTFCSDEMAIKFAVPGIFTGKLAKADNYEVTESSLGPDGEKSAGTSELVYSAKMTGNDNFTFTIAQEPLRSGYVDAPHALQTTYFDKSTGELTQVNIPMSRYDSAKDDYVLSGEYSKGAVVPSFDVDGIRVFKCSNGDAGRAGNIYLAVINDKIVKISLQHDGYMGDPANDPTTIDADKVFEELDKSIKALNVIKS